MSLKPSSSSLFPVASPALEAFGLKFSMGGAHISRTMMLKELERTLEVVPAGSRTTDYRDAILQRNILGKSTDSTRQKSLRHLRELYAVDETIPIFLLLRKLYTIDISSLPLLALQVAWGRDPLLRSTTSPVLEASIGERVETSALAEAMDANIPNQYSELNRNKIARNAASSWTQAGHLTSRRMKCRQRINPSTAAVTMALFLGEVAGYHGISVFSNPWCRLLDLDPDLARTKGLEAHRAGMLTMRAIGEVVELRFPLLTDLQGKIA